MTLHRTIRVMLYEHVRGDLDGRDARRVEEHLARCAACAAEAAALRSVLKVVPDASRRPSDALPDSYWRGFANEVMGRIEPGPVVGPGMIARIAGKLASLRPAWRLQAGLAAAVVAGALLWFVLPRGAVETPAPAGDPLAGRETEQPADEPAGRNGETPAGATNPSVSTSAGPARSAAEGPGREAAGPTRDSLTEFDRRVNDYFRRSRALLVGVSNLGPAEEVGSDLGTERSISRSLLTEARYLRAGPVDIRSYKLMDDLDQILIGLANSDARSAVPTVEVIRGGIESKNLLFKLRMQETRNYSTPFRQASYRK